MSAVEKKMSDEQAVNLVRNSLLVAGLEMGAEGDHWPVIKSTVHTIAKDWEDLKIERNAFAEVQKYYEGLIHDLDALRKGSPDALKIEIDLAIEQLQELYAACFDAVRVDDVYLEDMPHHLQRAEVIMNTLDGDHDD